MNALRVSLFEHYQSVFQDTRLMIIVLNTFMLAFLSALLATIIGTFGAMGIYYTRKRRTRTALLSLNNIFVGFTRCHHWCQLLDFLYDDRQLVPWV